MKLRVLMLGLILVLVSFGVYSDDSVIENPTIEQLQKAFPGLVASDFPADVRKDMTLDGSILRHKDGAHIEIGIPHRSVRFQDGEFIVEMPGNLILRSKKLSCSGGGNCATQDEKGTTIDGRTGEIKGDLTSPQGRKDLDALFEFLLKQNGGEIKIEKDGTIIEVPRQDEPKIKGSLSLDEWTTTVTVESVPLPTPNPRRTTLRPNDGGATVLFNGKEVGAINSP